MPLRVPVPFPLSTNIVPPGSVPDSLMEGFGKPDVVTVNVPAPPTENVALLALVIVGAWFTVSVKPCVAAVPTPLLAVIVKLEVPPVVVPGVPLSVAVPFPLSVNVTPLGRVTPPSLRAGGGNPVVITVNEPADPATNVVLLALVIAGAWPTVRVKLWLAGEPTPLLGVNVIGYFPAVPGAGVPAKVPVPFELLTKVTPAGSVPDSLMVGVGKPDAVTVNVPGMLTGNVMVLALVIDGVSSTVRVKVCVALLPIPLLAEIVIG